MNKLKKRNPGILLMAFLFSLMAGFSQQASSQVNQVDYTSKVPVFHFSKNLKEQEEQLKKNPVLLRFAESRKKLAADKFRPIFHYVNPENVMNDPNGLCFWQGRWHLFYQAFPVEDPRVHWGHAVSTDLIHWQDLPFAIYPNPERAVYSGSTIVEDDRVIAMYHGPMAGNMVAVSSDPLLLNWEKVTGKPVIPLKSSTGFPLPYSVFDPSIWKRDSVYYSLSAGRAAIGPGGKQVRANYLFRSKDLANWEYLHEFIEGDRFTQINDDGACPYFWPIGNRYIMPFFSHMSGGQYLLGDYDKARDKFKVINHGRFNFGAMAPSGVHAPSATTDGKGGVIILFNMNAGKPAAGWNQMMTLPRRLTLSDKDEVLIEPVGDIESLRYNHRHLDSMKLPANKEVVLKNISGNAMEMMVEIDPGKASMIELNVLRSPGKEEFTRIAFFREGGYGGGRGYDGGPAAKTFRSSVVCIESSQSSTLPDVLLRAPEIAPVDIRPDEPLKLRVFIDKSVVEVFVNGKQCLAVRVYPGLEKSTGVSLKAQGQDAMLRSLDAWQMKNIYE